jgi:glycosyltransferase involved in cell wall biosynthesis
MNEPLVSIIVPIRKGEDISLIKEAIDGSSYTNTELIVVDEGKERSEQRNIGIDKARGQHILWLDSDQVPSIFLIEECVKLLKCGYNALYITERIMGDSFFNRVRDFERSFYISTPVDCVRYLRKWGCPRFNIELNGPEDADFDRKVIGHRGVTKQPLYHFDHGTLKKYIDKKKYYSKSMKRYKELHPTDKVLDLRYRCIGIFIEKGKWRKLFRHPILSLGILFILIVRGFLWIRK